MRTSRGALRLREYIKQHRRGLRPPPDPPGPRASGPGGQAGRGGISNGLNKNPLSPGRGGAAEGGAGGCSFKSFENGPRPRAGGPGSRGVRGGPVAPPGRMIILIILAPSSVERPAGLTIRTDHISHPNCSHVFSNRLSTLQFGLGGGREGSFDLARTESFPSHLVSWNFVERAPSYGPKRVG